MKNMFFKFGVGSVLLALAILFGALSAGSLIASAHSTQSATSTPTSAACQQYLQGMAQRLNMPIATLEKQYQLAKGDTMAHTPCN